MISVEGSYFLINHAILQTNGIHRRILIVPLLNFFYINWVFKQRVMHISSNEIQSQNQLAIREVAHKLYLYT